MSAKVLIFSDEDCLHEVNKSGDIYDVTVGPVTGLDGDKGDRVDMLLYLKNTGDQIALDTTIEKADDLKGMLYISDGVKDYVLNDLVLGDIVPTKVKKVYIKIVVPAGSAAYIGSPIITAKFKTLP